ncbi:MAG: hypothetical protein IPK82_32140 [Polyangiaceae bacterium]|nr:hypothetical protein [Polyangiaceae bacterium]
MPNHAPRALVSQRTPRKWVRAVMCGFLFVGACDEKPRPWASGEGPPAVFAQAPSGVSTGQTTVADAPLDAGDADVSAAPGVYTTAAGTSAPAPGTGEPFHPDHPLTPGGLWVTCRDAMSLSGDPLKDVTRIGLLCGPITGLRRKTAQAIVGVIGEKDPPVYTSFRVQKGACYRVFAVADEGVRELDVAVLSSRQVRVAADHSDGRVAVVQPDRPFCTFGDDVFSLEIGAAKGGGRFAAEVWAIGERRRPGETTEPLDEPPLDKP